MIALLTGTLAEKEGPSVVLNVNGVGYELGVSQTTLNELPEVGTPSVSLFCRMRLTEQAVTLYGFTTKEERSVFDKLVTISGVGPKVALAILSTFTPATLAGVVAAQDEARMQSVSGVGKKMASRLLLELKGLFATDDDLSRLAGAADVADTLSAAETFSNVEEATMALMGLGYSPKEAEIAIKGAVKEKGKSAPVEDLLRFALGLLGGGRYVGSK